MKRISIFLMGILLAGVLSALEPTNFPSGVATYNDTREIMAASTTLTGIPASGDVWVKGNLIMKGKIITNNAEGMGVCREAWVAPPTSDTDTIRRCIAISTATLVSGTTIFPAGVFTMTRAARTIGCSFDVQFSSNWFYGTFTVSGINSLGHNVTEVIIATPTAVVYSNYAYISISSGILAITAWGDTIDRGGDVGIGGIAGSTGDLTYIFFRIASGPKLGLQNMPLDTTALSVVENATYAAGSGATLSTTYGTVDFATDPDNNNREVTYRISSQR